MAKKLKLTCQSCGFTETLHGTEISSGDVGMCWECEDPTPYYEVESE